MKMKQWLFWMVVGFSIRILLSQLGYNHDVGAYFHVGGLVDEGKVIYAHSTKFNYGFIMAYVFGFFYRLNQLFFDGSVQGMHFLVCALCSVFDLGIAHLLKNKFGPKTGLLFFLNPISLLITGYHTQFDNIAIYFGLLFWFHYSDQKKVFMGLFILGISLVIKHVFLLFLPWLLFDKRKSIKERIQFFLIPLLVFCLSFVPFLIDEASRLGVFEHVFSYNSFEKHSIIGLIAAYSDSFESINLLFFDGNLKKYIFISLLSLLGFFIMQKHPEKGFYIYLLGLVALSSGMTDQYLAITCVSLAVFGKNKILLIFAVLASAYLILDSRNNISGTVVFLQQFTDQSKILAAILSVAVCQFLLIIGLSSILIKDEKAIGID